jgi:hypothetical protein
LVKVKASIVPKFSFFWDKNLTQIFGLIFLYKIPSVWTNPKEEPLHGLFASYFSMEFFWSSRSVESDAIAAL